MAQFKQHKKIILLCVLIFIFCIIQCGNLFEMWEPKSSSDLAAWMQAVLSGMGIFFSVAVAQWTIRQEHDRRDAEEAEKNARFVERGKDMRIRADRFIRGACAAIHAMDMAGRGASSKYDVLLKGPMVLEELSVSRSIDLSVLDAVDSSAIMSAQSLCVQLEILMSEERISAASPPLPVLNKYLPQLNARAKEIESAWNERRHPSASKAGY